MKPIIYSLLSCVVLMFCSTSLYSVVAVHNAESQELSAEKRTKKNFKSLSAKKQRKLKKRLAKLQNKLQKKAARKNRKSAIDIDILEEPRFRLGALVFVAGLVVLLLAALFIGFGGLIVWVGNLAILIGLILMIWSLIEY